MVVIGNARIDNGTPGLTTITQGSNRAIINWGSFSIGAGEQARFIQPNASSATLNRVLGSAASLLDGRLTANGHVFLINTNGIIFGKGAVVDAAGLLASTLDTSNATFMAGGDMAFQGKSQAAVTNMGQITAASGDVFLIGLQVNNSGTIRAAKGTVGLAAGSEVLIKAVGDERVIVRNAAGSKKDVGVDNSGVIEASVAELKAHNGNVYALAIRNTGRIAATGVTKQGGRILLRANGGAIEHSGEMVARGSAGNGGKIEITAGNKGSATISGRVDADGPQGAGGEVAVTGGQVTIGSSSVVTANGKTNGGQVFIGAVLVGAKAGDATAVAGSISADGSAGVGGTIRLGGSTLTIAGTSVITANGALGGGSVLAGGGFRGTDRSMINSQNVTVNEGALLTANATDNGRGGNVVVFADKVLNFSGNLQARGGLNSGDGGQAELSGKGGLRIESLSGHVDLGATHGRAGGLLIDPNDILITDIGGGTPITDPAQSNVLDVTDVANFLNTANLTIQTDGLAGGGSGNITLDAVLSWSGANSLTINADRDFTMTSTLLTTGVIESLGGGNVTVNAGRAVVLEPGALITTTTGNVAVNANQGLASVVGDFNGITIGGSIETSGGNITLTGRTGSGGVVNTSAILLDGGSLRADLGGVLTLATTGGTVVGNGPMTTDGLKLSGNGGFTLTGPGNSIGTVATIGTVGSVNLENSMGLIIGTVGADSGVNATGNITFTTSGTDRLVIDQAVGSQGGAVSLNAYGIDINNAALSNTGAGTIHLTATRDITLNSGAAITVVNGILQLDANQGLVAETGTFEGIRLSDASLTTNGTGAILLNGKGGDTSDNNNGIAAVLGATINSTSTGTITLNGLAGGGDNSNRGVTLQNAGTAITSAGATININGTGVGTGTDNIGVDVGADVTITSDGAAVVTTDSINIDGAAMIGGAGTLTLKPLTAATTIGLGDGSTGAFSLTTAGIAAISGLSSVTIGDGTMGAVDIQATTWNAPVIINSAGAITVNGLLTGLGGAVTFNGASATLNAGITTDGGAIAINSAVTLGAGAGLDATNAGASANGANVTVTGAISGGVGTPNLTIDAGLTGDVTLSGAVGAGNTINTVNITGGTLVSVPTITATTFNLTANGMMNLTNVTASAVSVTGRSGNDTVVLTGVPTSLTVNGGGGTDTVTFASATGPISTSAGSYTGVENLTGSGNTGDTLIGASGNNTFLVTANNAGSVGGMNFTSFENLTGSNNGTNGFTFSQQATLDGVVDGGGGTSATLSVNDSNIGTGRTYTIGSGQVTTGSRQYQFQNITTVGLQLGSGNDTVNTNFFTFTQSLNGGGGDNRLLIGGTAVANSPQGSAGLGTISFSGFSVPVVPPVIPPVVTPPTVVPPNLTPIVGGSLLQNAVPTTGVFGGSTTPTTTPTTTTNNFTSTTTSTPSSTTPTTTSTGTSGSSTPTSTTSTPTTGTTTGSTSTPTTTTTPGVATTTSTTGPPSLPSGNSVTTPATSVTAATTGQGQGPVSMGGGAPASPTTQVQMTATTSATAQSELSATLGGDGTMGVVNGEGLVSVDPGSGPPSVTATAELNTGTSLLAQSELAIGTGGLGEAPVSIESGAQAMDLGGAPPTTEVQQGMASTTSAESFSDLSLALGGDGTTHTDSTTGSLAMDVNGEPVPAETNAELASNTSPGSLGELSAALGGTGEVVVTPSRPATNMDPSGTPASPQVQAGVDFILSASAESEMSLTLGGDGTALLLDWDGNLGSGLNGAPLSPLVTGQLGEATSKVSAEELDKATR